MKLNLREMELACKLKTKNFKKYIPYNEKGRYWFQDNGANILAVAHLDSVQDYTHFHEMKLPHKHWVFCPTLDDRLGVYIIYYVLPLLKCKYDILFTTDEEIGKSTASKFVTDKKYNWIFEFDRKGKDVVMYDYETKELKENLNKVGWDVGDGSYSDICDLEHLGCKAFNFGTGYQDYHSKDAYVDLYVMVENIQKFFLFYNKFKDVELPHVKVVKKYQNWRNWRENYSYGHYYDDYGYGDWDDDDKNLTTGCKACGGKGFNSKGGKCIPCNGDGWVFKDENPKKKDTTSDKAIILLPEKTVVIPTHSDIYSYSCTDCGTYNEIDIDNCDVLSMEAAEMNLCRTCYQNKVFFV